MKFDYYIYNKTTTMKKIILLLMIPLFTLGQSNEKTQKQSYRSGTPYTPRTSPQVNSRPSIGEFEQKQIERERNRYKPGTNSPVIITDPYWDPYYSPYLGWGWNRYYPYTGWNYYNRFWWNDNWGYRNPGRVYIYEDGTRDTVKIKPLHGSIGISYNNQPEWGVWTTLGREVYLIAEYSRSFQTDRSTYYPNITKDQVLEWNDKKIGDQINTNLFSIGVGKKVSKYLGLHVQLGIGRTVVREKYLDEYQVLSNNGQYSIDNYTENIVTPKVGGLYKLGNKFTFKGDYDIKREKVQFGLGVNF